MNKRQHKKSNISAFLIAAMVLAVGIQTIGFASVLISSLVYGIFQIPIDIDK